MLDIKAPKHQLFAMKEHHGAVHGAEKHFYSNGSLPVLMKQRYSYGLMELQPLIS